MKELEKEQKEMEWDHTDEINTLQTRSVNRIVTLYTCTCFMMFIRSLATVMTTFTCTCTVCVYAWYNYYYSSLLLLLY